MQTCLFMIVTCLTWTASNAIYGGSMSYSTSHGAAPGEFKVKLFFLNGWKLQQGPCYNCTERDDGVDVAARRKQYIIDKSDPYAFGKWKLEIETKGTEQSAPRNLTVDVNNYIRDVVLMVNLHEDWELESSEINLLIQPNKHDKRRFAITFDHFNDGLLTNLGENVKVFLQVKVDPYNRTDTGKPNNSPVILVKPYYSLENGKVHILHIPAVDNDDDFITCGFSKFIEAGVFGPLVQNLTTGNVISMDEQNCVFTINLQHTRFSSGETFALPITVKDYSRKYLLAGVDYFAYGTPIGIVTALMFFKVTGMTEPPVIIPPTPPNNQEYTIYVGGDFHVRVYAKPTDITRTIRKFNFLRRDGRHVNQSSIQRVSGDPNAVYIGMGWSPVDSDIGKHILCANAEDSQGISTVELHCFKIDVKAHIFRPNPSLVGKPYYPSFPDRNDLVCAIGSYCRFPIYAATDNTGGIDRIISTEMSKENVTIQYSSDVINGSIDTKVAQVQFLAVTPGPRQICLNATDQMAWTVRCLIVTVQRQDPCETKPCKNQGDCTPFKDKSGFKCICDALHNGSICENKIKMCNKTTCGDFVNCMEAPGIRPFFLCLQCPSGKTGVRCDVDIDLCHPNNCNDTFICQQNASSYECHLGVINQQCPHTCLRTESSVCVKDQCVCALMPQQSNSCKSGTTHALHRSNKPTFIKPTPSSGSILVCDVYALSCEFPVYISSITSPVLSFFNGTNVFKISGRKISFSAFEIPLGGVYKSTVSLTKLTKPWDDDPTNHEFDLCLNVARLSTPQNITDAQCFQIVDKKVPLQNYGSPISHNPDCSFLNPTLPKESIIGCKKGEPCHFYMYAKAVNGNCSILTTNNPATGVFNPTVLSGRCRYEIVYTNTSVVGEQSVCVMICSKGESRCFQMKTYARDLCGADPCLNGGYCVTEGSGDFRCYCQKGFWGTRCDEGFCDSQIYCKNKAVCFTSNGMPVCLCHLGFQGPTCSFEVNRNLTSQSENGGHFGHMSFIESLTCLINAPCKIPVSIARNIHSDPKVEVGFLDKTLEVQKLEMEPAAVAGGMVRGTLTVIGQELGVKTICLDSVANPRTAKFEDEVCFCINVMEGNVLEPIQTVPYFVSPTLPTSTVLQCVVDQQCYLSLWAKNKLGINKCPKLEVDKSIEDGVYIFPADDTTTAPCVFDSVILVHNVTDLLLCFSLPLDESSSHLAIDQTDTRCYTIRILPKVTVKGSCAGLSCYNDGFCDGRSASPHCLCRSGFSNNTCVQDNGVAQGNDSDENVEAVFGDVALPKIVRCPLMESCTIPFSVTKTDYTLFHITWNGTNIESVNISRSHIPRSRDFSGITTIVHNALGKDEFCLTLEIRGAVHDSVCCHVLTETAAAHHPPDIGQGLFISPSPSNNSEFSCTPGKPCHIKLQTSKGSNQKCPDLLDTSSLPVHVFTALDSEECERDVLISSNSSYKGPETYCFQIASSGVHGELRCITIHFEKHVLPPPPPTRMTTESLTSIIPTTEITVVDGGWSTWGHWSECKPNCGDLSVRVRYRQCNNSIPQNGGKICEGQDYDITLCNVTSYPKDKPCPSCDENLNCSWDSYCDEKETCMIRSYSGFNFTVHCSKIEDCLFEKAVLSAGEIFCCDDLACLQGVLGV